MQPGATPEQIQIREYDSIDSAEKTGAADAQRQKFTNLVWDDEGSLETTSQKMDIIREGFPGLLAELADGTIDSRTTGSRQKYLVTSMHRLAVGHPSPDKRKLLWDMQLNRAAHAAGIPNNDVAAINEFKSRVQKKLKSLAYSFAPISEKISEEEIKTRGTRGTVPDATHGDLYRQQGGGEFIATLLSGVGSTVAGGYGANRKQLEAAAQLILEPTGGKPINENQMAGLFQVGGVSGLLGGTDTFYKTTDLVAWQLDEEMSTHLDENEGGGLDVGQALEEIAWQLVQPAAAALTGGGSTLIPAAGRLAASAPGVAKLAGLGSRVGSALGPGASAAKEALSRLVLTKPNPVKGIAFTYPPRVPTLAGKILPKVSSGIGATGRVVAPYAKEASKLYIAEEAARKLLGDLQKIPIPYVKEPWGASYGRINNPLE